MVGRILLCLAVLCLLSTVSLANPEGSVWGMTITDGVNSVSFGCTIFANDGLDFTDKPMPPPPPGIGNALYWYRDWPGSYYSADWRFPIKLSESNTWERLICNNEGETTLRWTVYPGTGWDIPSVVLADMWITDELAGVTKSMKATTSYTFTGARAFHITAGNPGDASNFVDISVTGWHLIAQPHQGYHNIGYPDPQARPWVHLRDLGS